VEWLKVWALSSNPVQQKKKKECIEKSQALKKSLYPKELSLGKNN
jgi:hypothetical protein